MSRLAPAFTLVDAAREIQLADAMLGEVVGSQLVIIADQIRALQQQAKAVLDKACMDAELHRATCRFGKRPGRIYHFYERADGVCYVSMLSPEEWGTPPHRHRGGYRLEADMSWTPIADIEHRESARAGVARLLGGGRGTTDT